MINKIKQILKLNDIAKYYKKKTSQGRSIEENNHESGLNFPTLNKKERFDARLIYYLGKYITFQPFLKEVDENQRELEDPKNAHMDHFEDRCVLYPTPKEEYEEIDLTQYPNFEKLEGMERKIGKVKTKTNKDFETLSKDEKVIERDLKKFNQITSLGVIKSNQQSLEGSNKK